VATVLLDNKTKKQTNKLDERERFHPSTFVHVLAMYSVPIIHTSHGERMRGGMEFGRHGAVVSIATPGIERRRPTTPACIHLLAGRDCASGPSTLAASRYMYY